MQVVKELVYFYGASFADVMNVAAFTCVKARLTCFAAPL